MRLPRLSENTIAVLKKLPIYYLFVGFGMVMLTAVLSMPVPDFLIKIISVLLIAYIVAGCLGVVGYVLAKTWIAWLSDKDSSLAYRMCMGAAFPVIAGFVIARLYTVALAAALIHVGIGALVALANKNAKEEADRDSTWEEAEEDFWQNYNASGSGNYSKKEQPPSYPDPSPDPWLVLGLEEGASREAIRSAYRAICRACHPDTNGGQGDPARFRRATEAYHALSG